MTTPQVAAILALDEKRTQGPWYVLDTPLRELRIHGEPDGDADDEGRSVDCTEYIATIDDTQRGDDNAAFIAAAPTMVSIIKQQQAEIEALRKDAERYRWLRDGCRNVQSAEAMERILANWMEWTPLEGDMAIDAEIVK